MFCSVSTLKAGSRRKITDTDRKKEEEERQDKAETTTNENDTEATTNGDHICCHYCILIRHLMISV